jgi:hypothetical protein
MLQAFILLPVGALLYLPFLRLAARWLSLERLSFGSAFQLGVMVWASGLVASQVAAPFIPDDRRLAAAVLAVASLAVSSAICGYYVVTPGGRSVGMRKGFYLAAVSQALLAAALVSIVGLVALLFGYAL